MLKIGVRLPRQFEDSGDYLADARAMESAGADSLWLDAEGYDPWILLAGMATVTRQIRLIVPVSRADRRDPQSLGVRVATLSRLSRGRAALALTGTDESDARVDAIIDLASRSQCCVLLEASDDRRAGLADGLVGLDESPERFRVLVEPVTRRRERERLTSPFERWAAFGFTAAGIVLGIATLVVILV